ncbi:hypothetical protein JEQ12_002153 [Ovis aries]|uniref:Uncharacterized protein n=1 Tax=Ovis aries TaxID=9940 RepID=A0A836A9Z8_SHEEP|nr:hypothetical protein JEQ12_002153 [Ovis aries]
MLISQEDWSDRSESEYGDCILEQVPELEYQLLEEEAHDLSSHILQPKKTGEQQLTLPQGCNCALQEKENKEVKCQEEEGSSLVLQMVPGGPLDGDTAKYHGMMLP